MTPRPETARPRGPTRAPSTSPSPRPAARSSAWAWAALDPLAERRAELAADPESQPEAVELGMLELRALTRLGRWPEAHELAHTLHEIEGREGAAFIDDDGQEIALWRVALITQLELDEDPPGLDLERGAGWAAERSPKHDFTDDDRPRWSPNELSQLLVVARDAQLARRWRGDPEAEQRWRSRRASLLALAPSPDDRVLLHLAGF